MNLSILLTRGHRLLSLAAIVDVFETVNSFLEDDGELARFDIQLVGLDDPAELPENFRKYRYLRIPDMIYKNDILFVPAFRARDMQQTIQDNIPFIPLLTDQYKKGATIVSLCTGAFLLGAAGLLNGRAATTHIDASEAFAQQFPEVSLQPHAVLTQSENIYTSGGATSSFHMKLLLIQQYCGREMAVRIAKNFAIDMDRNNQLYFEHFKPALSKEDELVRSVQTIINARFSELRSVEEALEKVPSSRRNIIRRFKHATGMTPIRYLQKTKIESAKKLLETTDKDILEVMVSSGYSDLKNFRQLFKSFTGLSPRHYREKYGMRLV